MRRGLCSPYGGLIMTGTAATIALLIETQLPVSADTHFLIQFVWVGVVGAALLTFSLKPALDGVNTESVIRADAASQDEGTIEFFDEDRLWLQTHPNSNWNGQV